MDKKVERAIAFRVRSNEFFIPVLENIDVEFIVVSGDDFVVKHTYFEDDEFVYDFNFETNVLTLENDTDDTLNFFWDPSQLFRIINNRNTIRIEIPADLVIEDVDIVTSNGLVIIRNILNKVFIIYIQALG